MRSFRNTLVALLLILVIVLVFQNREDVQTRLLFVTVTMPRAMLLATTFLTGLAVGLLLAIRKPKLGSA